MRKLVLKRDERGGAKWPAVQGLECRDLFLKGHSERTSEEYVRNAAEVEKTIGVIKVEDNDILADVKH